MDRPASEQSYLVASFWRRCMPKRECWCWHVTVSQELEGPGSERMPPICRALAMTHHNSCRMVLFDHSTVLSRVTGAVAGISLIL